MCFNEEVITLTTFSQVNISEWEEWALSVKYDPRPVKMHLVPIYYLLSNSHPGKQALIDATNDYLAKNEQEKQDNINAMNDVKPPPPEMCSKYDQMTTPPVSQEVGHNPADELCPFVGKNMNS